MNLKLARGIFGALVVGALGFGATQALASPVQAAVRRDCTLSEERQCQNYCTYNYGPGALGRCTNFGGYECRCEFGPNIPDPERP